MILEPVLEKALFTLHSHKLDHIAFVDFLLHSTACGNNNNIIPI